MKGKVTKKGIREMEQQLQRCYDQLETLKEINVSCRALCHDMKHHMLLLTDYIQHDENERALEYLEKLNYHLNTSGRYVNTGHYVIDSILNQKIKEIQEVGGKIAVDIKIKDRLLMDDFDMNVILGNLLSNACEATKKCENKEINIRMQYDRGIFKIKINNSYGGEVKEGCGYPVTVKKDKKNHGIGLLSVKRIVKKYGGDLSTTYNENEFCVVAILYT